MKKEFLDLRKGIIITSIMSIIASIIATIYDYTHEHIFLYSDAESHIDIAKRVVSSITPGLAQLGGEWLPLDHILMVPFVISNFLWRSGLAGSIVNGLALLLLTIYAYKFSYLLIKNSYISLIAPIVILLNFNVLYLSTTPLDDILMLSLGSVSIYYFVKWAEDDSIYSIILASIFVFFASITRYDGWFLAVGEFCAVVLFEILKKKKFDELIGVSLLYSFMAFAGMIGWLIWNKLIFGNYLFFANSQYSSSYQQRIFFLQGNLPTYHNIMLSVLVYLGTCSETIGEILSVFAVIGLLLFIFNLIFKSQEKLKMFAVLLSLYPILFYVIALYLGQASIFLPFINNKYWISVHLFNVRYGIQIMFAASIFITYLISKIKYSVYIIFVLLILQTILMVRSNTVISFEDGLFGASSSTAINNTTNRSVIILEQWVNNHYDKWLVLMDSYRRHIGFIPLGVPMQNFISQGNRIYWDTSMIDPSRYATWIILQRKYTDAVWTGIKNKQLLFDEFVPVYNSSSDWVFKRRVISSRIVSKSGTNLYLNNKPFISSGVNSYGLMVDSKQHIDTIFKNVSEEGFNTIRFWAFDSQGGITPSEFNNFDYIIKEADLYNIKLIPVFSNNWSNYGGIQATFTTNSNPDVYSQHSQNGIENRITEILNRTNSYTGVKYKDDSAIFAWDIMNEPRVDNSTASEELLWINNVANYTHSLDQKHLVTIGTEGLSNTQGYYGYSINGEAPYSSICALYGIDICSVHVYPKYFGTNYTISDIYDLLGKWQGASKYFSKPLLVEEFGYPVSNTESTTYSSSLVSNQNLRNTFLDNVLNVVKADGINGSIIWGYSLNEYGSFNINPGDTLDLEFINNWVK